MQDFDDRILRGNPNLNFGDILMQTNVIYYYSGTGNSLAIAEKLAQKLGNTTIVSIKNSPGRCSCLQRLNVSVLFIRLT